MNAAEEHEIRNLAAAGLSQREIAKRVGLSRPTIAKVLAARPRSLPAHMGPPPPAPPPSTSAPDAPALEIVRELMSEARAQFALATHNGDSSGAQRYARTAAGLTPVLARLEREDLAESGGYFVTPEEQAKAEAMIDERIRLLAERLVPGSAAPGGLRCCDCGRQLSVQWGMASTPPIT